MVKKIFAIGALTMLLGLVVVSSASAAWDVTGYAGPSSTDTLAMANGTIGVVWDNIEAILPTLITFAVVMALIFGAVYFVLKRLHILR